MEKITTVGIDLAKSVFSLHRVDGAGRVVLRKTVRRIRSFEAPWRQACRSTALIPQEHTMQLS